MEPPFSYVLSFEAGVSQVRTVAISAAIAAASVCLTVFNSVQTVYHRFWKSGEEFLNIYQLIFVVFNALW